MFVDIFVDIFENFMMFDIIFKIFYLSSQERIVLLLFQYKKGRHDSNSSFIFFYY